MKTRGILLGCALTCGVALFATAQTLPGESWFANSDQPGEGRYQKPADAPPTFFDPGSEPFTNIFWTLHDLTPSKPLPPEGGADTYEAGVRGELCFSSISQPMMSISVTGTVIIRMQDTTRAGAATRTFDTEMLQMDLAGASPTGPLRIRESPTQASPGRTSVRPADGTGFWIDSFFDVFTEFSTDGGQTWTPASGPVHLERCAAGMPGVAPMSELPSPVLELRSPVGLLTRYQPPGNPGDILADEFFLPAVQGGLAPPPPGSEFVIGLPMTIGLRVAEGGQARHVSVPATAVMLIRNAGECEPVQQFDTEMLALDLAGGGLPGGLMIRESPTLPSRGKTSLRMLPGGNWAVDSFFDIFTELSVDGGQTWTPSADPTHLSSEPRTPGQFFLTDDFPGRSAFTVKLADLPLHFGQPAAGEVMLRNLRLGMFESSSPLPPLGAPQPYNLRGVLEFEHSFDGGATYAPNAITATCQVVTMHVADDGQAQTFDTEMLSLSLSGAPAGTPLMVRESPTRASTGRLRVRLPEGGGFRVDSFFDIWTEISLDGGQTWQPADRAARMREIPEPPAHLFSSPNLPPRVGDYMMPTGMVVAFPHDVRVKEFHLRHFNNSFAPPAPGIIQTQDVELVRDFKVSTDGGLTFVPSSASARLIRRVVNTFSPAAQIPAEWDPHFASWDSYVFDVGTWGLDDFVSTRTPQFRIQGGGGKEADSAWRADVVPSGNNARVDSFFDIFTELSIDGGQTWQRSLEPVYLELRADPPPVATLQNSFAPSNTLYQLDPCVGLGTDSGVVLRHLELPELGPPSPLPPPNLPAVQNFSGQARGEISLNGGLSFQAWTGFCDGSVRIAHFGDNGGSSFFDTEMLSLNLQSASPIPIMVRESPTQASLGRASSSQSPTGGGFEVSSFFDIWTEISFDGGQTWTPALRPGRTVLVPPTQPPCIELICPGLLTNWTCGDCAPVDYAVTVTNRCPGQPTEVIAQCNPPPGSCFPVGTNRVTCLAFADGQVVDQCTFHIIVVRDTKPPVITCPPDQSLFTCNPNGVISEFGAFAEDDCDPNPGVFCNPPPGSLLPPGTNEVVCDAFDACGNFSQCRFVVVVVADLLPPDITCPNDILVSTCDPAGMPVTFTVTATDDTDPSPVVVCNPPSGSNFPPGTTPVICRATDKCGHTNECSFKVTVASDTVPPEITCPTNISVWTCLATGEVVTYPVTASDPGGGPVTINCNPPSGSTFPVGTTTVTCTAEDACHNKTDCRFTVTVVQDTKPPEITCPADQIRLWTCSNEVAVTWNVSATDDCDTNVTITCNPPSGSLFPPGNTPVVCIARDDCNHESQCQFSVVVVKDTTPPVLDCPSNIVVRTWNRNGASVTFNVTATDDCDTNVTINCVPPSGTLFPVGVSNVVCTAVDDCGNRAVCTFEVRVLRPVEIDHFPCTYAELTLLFPDNQTEVVTLHGPTTVEVCIDDATGEATDTDGDGRDQVPTEMVQLDLAGASAFGPMQLRLQTTPQSTGEIEELNNATPGRLDLLPFAPTGLADSFFDVFFEVSVPGQTLHNALPLRMASVIRHKPPGPGEVFTNTGGINLPGTVCLAPDNGAGTAWLPPTCCEYVSSNEVFRIIDGLPLGTTILLAGTNGTFVCTVTGTPGACFVTDDGDPANGETEQFSSTLDFRLQGTGDLAGYNRSLTIPNVQNRVQAGPRTPGNPVQSFDTEMLGLQGQITGDPDFDLLRITAGSGFGLPSPGHTTLMQQPGGQWAVDSFFDITYRIDFVGAPGGPLAGHSGSTTGTIRMHTTSSCPNPVGGVDLLDPNGNPSGIRVIRVVHVPVPTNCVQIVCPSNIVDWTCSPNGKPVDYKVSATNVCCLDTNLAVVCVPPPGSAFPVGTTTVICTASNGVEVTRCSFTVTLIRDTQPPVITCPSNFTVRVCSSNAPVTWTVTATDDCDTNVTIVCNPPSGSILPSGVHSVVCFARDACDNTSQCGFEVRVCRDVEPPRINCPTNITRWICQGDGLAVTYVADATDDCGLASFDCTPPSGSFFPEGTTPVLCRAVDECGRSNECSFVVRIIRDTQPPVVTCPSNIVVRCADAAGAPVTWTTSATDDCDTNVTVNCQPPSGTVFPPGVTTVVCIGTDDCGNQSECSFTVTVQPGGGRPTVCPDATWFVFAAGDTNDNFAGPEPAFPSAGLVAGLAPTAAPLKGFDDCTVNRYFAHSFTNLPPCITEAILRIRIRGCGDVVRNDAIGLAFFRPDGSQAAPRWGRYLGSGNAAPGLLGVPWTANSVQEFVLDLSALPLPGGGTADLIPTLALLGWVDVLVQDDSAVDYVVLTVKSCCCRNDIVVAAPPDQCCAPVTYTPPVFTNDCGGPITVECKPPSGFCFPVGTTLVECTGTDDAGQVGRCFFRVIVRDTVPPVIVFCPTNVVACLDGTNTGLMPNLVPRVIATDNCTPAADLVITQNPPPGSVITGGPVTFTVTDAAGNSTACTQPTIVEPCCVPPPSGLVLWLPFDENAGPTAFNAAGGNNGQLQNGPVRNPSGYVVRSLCFDGINDVVVVPSYSAINMGTNGFSIDAWVLRDPQSGNTVRVIVDKRFPQTGIGYSLAISFGNLVFQLADPAGFTNFRDTAVVPADNQWHFVAVTVCRGLTNGGQFYVDGVPTATFDPTVRPGNLNNPGAFLVGRAQIAGNSPWLGCIDEVEVFRRCLRPQEIRRIFNAHQEGKCRTRCILPWDVPICLGRTSVVVTATICNPSLVAQTYLVQFHGLPPGPGCTYPGPTFFSPANGTITVPPGGCVNFPVTIGVPPGMPCGAIACYEMVVIPAGTRQRFACEGSIYYSCRVCPRPPVTQTNIVGGGVVNVGNWQLDNNTDQPIDLTGAQLRAIGPDMEPDTRVVSLNGLPPGEPWIVPDGTILPPGGGAAGAGLHAAGTGGLELPLDVQFVEPDPGQVYTILLEADLDGDGVPEVLASLDVVNEVPSEGLLQVQNNGDGTLTLTWPAGWALEQSNDAGDPAGWSDAPQQTSPVTISAAGAAKFYRLRQ